MTAVEITDLEETQKVVRLGGVTRNNGDLTKSSCQSCALTQRAVLNSCSKKGRGRYFLPQVKPVEGINSYQEHIEGIYVDWFQFKAT